jgi:putative ABC transport system permease protein
VSALPQQFRQAVRSLLRAPLLTGAAVLSLTLGIAATTTVFSLIDGALLRQPPFPQANRLAILTIVHSSPTTTPRPERWSWPRFELLRQSQRSFELIASFSVAVLTITGVQDPEPLQTELVSRDYFDVLRVGLTAGPGFVRSALSRSESSTPQPSGVAAESEIAQPPSVVLGYGLWQRRFGGDAGAIGRAIRLNGVPVTIVGIAPRDFSGVSGRAQIWASASSGPRASYADYFTTNQNFISVIGRLRDGVALDQARRELAVLGSRIQQAEPSEMETPNDEYSATASSLNDARVNPVMRRALGLLLGAVSVLLLIACANVASLLLGRATGRRREIAIRLAVGATRGRLIRQLLGEGAILGGLSAIAAILVTTWVMGLVRVPAAMARPRNFYGAIGEFSTPGLDARMLLFVVGLGMATVLLFALVPALRATRADLVTDLKSGRPQWSGPFGRHLGLREMVVSLQVALAVVLLVGGGLLLASYSRLRDTTLGFEPDHLLTFAIRPSEVKYNGVAAAGLIDRVLAEIERVPGVVAASVDGCAPLAGRCASAQAFLVGRPNPPAAEAPEVLRHYVGPDHFRTLGLRLVQGRTLTAQDRAGRPHVVVINQTAAHRFWPGEDPIGKRIWWDAAATYASVDSAAEVVGVVSDMAYYAPDESPVLPSFFTPFAQFTYASRTVLVRTAGDPMAAVPAVAAAVRRADPDLALLDVQPMTDLVGGAFAKQSFQSMLLGVVAVVALLLAATGIYAVTAHFVASRTRELGVRVALGASEAQVMRASASRTIRLGAAGVAAGILGAFAATRVLRSLLYDTSPLDPRVFVTALVVLLGVLALASWLPVRRALRVNPVEVLRAE